MSAWLRSRCLLGLLLAGAACGGGEPEQRVQLGPVDGQDLPGEDLDRIQVGDAAPDFTLESLRGGPVTLSEFRGDRDVVLVFYRGHW